MDAVKCANALRIEGKTSEDVCMIFDEMYLQKSQEYFWREMIGCDDERELHKSIVCFMIVGLKESISYVIKSSPETNIDANWLKTELSFKNLKNSPSKFFPTVAFVLELSFVTVIRRMCLVSRNRWNMSTRIRISYTCYTSPETSTFATTLPFYLCYDATFLPLL